MRRVHVSPLGGICFHLPSFRIHSARSLMPCQDPNYPIPLELLTHTIMTNARHRQKQFLPTTLTVKKVLPSVELWLRVTRGILMNPYYFFYFCSWKSLEIRQNPSPTDHTLLAFASALQSEAETYKESITVYDRACGKSSSFGWTWEISILLYTV